VLAAGGSGRACHAAADAGAAGRARLALAALQRFILAYLGDAEAIVVLDETAELKKGTMSRRAC
jgi:hypothetical protein